MTNKRFDVCLTNFEVDLASDESKGLKNVEDKIMAMDNKLDNISQVLNTKMSTVAPTPSIWNNTERVKQIRDNFVIVQKNDQGASVTEKRLIEDIVIKNKIAMKNSYENKAGDLVLICDTSSEKEKLKSLVESANPTIKMHTPVPKMKSVSIVGMPTEFTSADFINHLQTQNSAVSNLAEKSKFEEHFKFKACKSLKNDESKFQVFCLLSDELLDIFQQQNNKVMIGLCLCKLYLQNSIMRCFNCQQHGHIAKICKNSTKCGKCAQSHATKECTSSTSKCVNCEGSGSDDSHFSYDHRCPINIKAVAKITAKEPITNN